jgi:hypothetical protein
VCSKAAPDCEYFWIFTVDAGVYSPEVCSRSHVKMGRAVDGGEVVEGLAWCPSGLVRLRADVIDPCPPTLIY